MKEKILYDIMNQLFHLNSIQLLALATAQMSRYFSVEMESTLQALIKK